MRPVGDDFDLRRRFGRRRRFATFSSLRDGERHAEHIHVLGQEQPVFVGVVGDPAEASAHDLLAEQLRGERPQTHDVRHVLCVPPF